MKRVLPLLPAAAAGLLLGWAICRFTANDRPGTSAPALPGHGLNSNATRANGTTWQDIIESRAPLTLQSEKDGPNLGTVIDTFWKESQGLSPARRRLTVELARWHDRAGTAGLAVVRGVEANAGFDAAVIRLAKNNPVFAMRIMDGQMRSDSTHGNVSRDGLGVEGIRRGVFREWLKIDAKAVLAYVNAKASVWSRGSDLSTLMQEWSSIDPATAAGALKTLPESGSAFAGKGHAEAVMRGWYAKDPAAANRWAQTLDDPALRESLNTLAAELAATDPAAKAAVLLAAPQRDGHGLATALGEWLTGDPTAALTKLSALPAGDKFWANHAADTAQRWAMSSRNGTTPEQFLESISVVPAGAQREAMIKGLASYGASNDIPFAVRMVAEMGEGRARDEAIGMLTELWMRKDPVKTSEWLATLPADSGSRHSGVARFAESLASDDPERAAVWAATLPDSFWQKEGVMKTVLEKWRAKDPAAAEAWAGGK